MDPFSIATGLAGLISLTSDIVRILTDYTGGVKSANKDARSVLAEVAALSHVLQQLIEFLRKDDTNSKCRFRETSALCSVIAICKNHIETIYRKVKFQGKPEKDLLSQLKWPFQKQDCQEIVEVLHRCSQTFTFSLQIANCELLSQTSTEVVARLDEEKGKLDSITSMFPTIPVEMKHMRNTIADIRAFVSVKVTSELEKISNSVEGLEKGLQDDQRKKILNWLSPLQPQKRHQDVRSMRLNNTGGWLLNDKRFTAWCTGGQGLEPEDRILCCYGMPGAGKTVICSAVIDYISDDLEPLTPSKGTVGIACFYCDYRDQATQKGTQIIGSLVAQFLAGLPGVPGNIVKAFTNAQKTNTNLEFHPGLSMLESLVRTYDNSYLCIDAVDELEVETQQALLQAIQELLNSSGGYKTRVLFTGRPHIKPHILQHFTSAASSTDREIEIVASEDDISCFLSHYIETKDPIADRSAMDDELRCKIITTITKKSGGMFLLPALHIQAILEEPTIGDREDALDKLPDKLHGAFKNTITRIRNQSQTRAAQGMMVLTWVFLAKRPLSLEELRHALAVRTEVEIPKSFDAKRLCSRDILLGFCLGLVIVDDETSTVRLVHFSLQEFLARRALEVPVEPGHASIARVCLKYLHFYGSKLNNHHGSRKCTGCSCQKEYPLLRYAATEWGHHARDGRDSSLHALALYWLTIEGGPNMCAFNLLSITLCRQEHHLCTWPYNNCSLTALHHAAYFGESGIFQGLYSHLNRRSSTVELNTKDAHGWTSLTWAASRGCKALVTLLCTYDRLELDVNPCDTFWRTPLSYAAIKGDIDIVACLLALTPRVNPDHRDHDGLTPLALSAQYTHAKVVRLLVEYPGVDLNSQDEHGKTPLHLAAWSDLLESLEVVECLLRDYRVNPSIQDTDGRTPLHLAKSPEVIECLLRDHRVDPNPQGFYGKTPLHLAKSPEVIECLLRDLRVNPTLQDANGQTPLHLATQEGILEVMECLLRDHRVDPNLQDRHGQTPLHLAESPEVIECLLRDLRVDPNLQEIDGQTPLHLAAGPQVIECLLQDPRVDPNVRNYDGFTPLMLLVRNYTAADIYKLISGILSHPRVALEAKDNCGRTALSHAAATTAAFKVPRVYRCKECRTPDGSLSRRARKALEDRQASILQALLPNGADPHTRDDEGRSPLDWALSLGDLKSTSCIDLLQKYMSGELIPTSADRKQKVASLGDSEPSGKRLALDVNK